MNNKPLVDDRYTQLARVLMDAMEQAAGGKGKERHADGERFENQKICVINRWLRGSPVAGALFQAVKKSVESSRMPPSRAIRELYGAINYISAAIILLEELMNEPNIKPKPDVPLIEMNCLCLTGGEDSLQSEVDHQMEKMSFDAVNRELRDMHETEQGDHIPSVGAKSALFKCENCYHRKLLPSEMPCKKCIDKPFRPHFLLSTPVNSRPPMPV